MGKHYKCQFEDARRCPKCGKKKAGVVFVGSGKHGLLRRRECLKCGYRYKTIEVYMDFLEEVFGKEDEQTW